MDFSVAPIDWEVVVVTSQLNPLPRMPQCVIAPGDVVWQPQ